MSSTKTSAQVAEEEKLRRGVAQAVTWEDFGKFLKEFRGKKVSLRALEDHLHLTYTPIWAREEGRNRFEEDELRAYLAACGADDELIAFCLHHHRRIAVSLPQQATPTANSRHELSDQFEDSRKSQSNKDASVNGFTIPSQPARKGWTKGLLSFIGLCTVLMLLMSITPKLYFTIKWWIAGWTTTVYGYGMSPSACLAADHDNGPFPSMVYMRVCSQSAQIWRLTPIVHTEAKKFYNDYPPVRNLIDVDSGKCLDVTAGVDWAIEQTCNNSLTQSWQIQIPVVEPRDLKESVLASFYNLGRQACLATTSNGGYRGTPLTIAACPDESHQMSYDYESKKYRITEPDWPTWPSWVPWARW